MLGAEGDRSKRLGYRMGRNEKEPERTKGREDERSRVGEVGEVRDA